jgi:hypothetical protein
LNVNNDLKQLLAALDRLVAAHQRGVWDYVSVIAVVLTLLVLIWYTVETYMLRVAAVKQLGVATTPILMIAPVPSQRDRFPHCEMWVTVQPSTFPSKPEMSVGREN